jgi:hypothetical protein
MIEKHPLICPQCQGKNIEYFQDAGVWFSQKATGSIVEVEEESTEYFDTLLNVWCRDCGFKDDGEPSFSAWRGL